MDTSVQQSWYWAGRQAFAHDFPISPLESPIIGDAVEHMALNLDGKRVGALVDYYESGWVDARNESAVGRSMETIDGSTK